MAYWGALAIWFDQWEALATQEEGEVGVLTLFLSLG